MDSSTLRYLWTVIEETQTGLLLRLNDTDLVEQLIQQLGRRKTLSRDERIVISAYLYNRTPLIRDIAHARRAAG
ncbi:hypothetical protein IFO70_27780 [Phormidium tenue FACHB-886]|nr:hypothetical protein [Phormidium tenue FACHB-886]